MICAGVGFVWGIGRVGAGDGALALCSSSADGCAPSKWADHRWLDADSVGLKLRPDRHISHDVHRRDAVHHEHLDLDNVDRMHASSGNGCTSRGRRQHQ